MESYGNLIPAIYLETDQASGDGSLQTVIGALDSVQADLDTATDSLRTVTLPRETPDAFVSEIAASLGNPFPFMTTERWRDGNKTENLTNIYSTRGTKPGIVNAVHYLCGVDIVLLQDFDYGWKLGVSILGS